MGYKYDGVGNFGLIVNFDEQKSIISLTDRSEHWIDQKNDLYSIWIRMIIKHKKEQYPLYIESNNNGIAQLILPSYTDCVQFVHPLVDGRYKVALMYCPSLVSLNSNHPKGEVLFAQLSKAITDKSELKLIIDPMTNEIVYISK